MRRRVARSPRQRGRTADPSAFLGTRLGPVDGFRRTDKMESLPDLRPRLHPSGLMLAARITLPHFSASSLMSLPKSAGEPARAAAPKSASPAFILGSARAAFISLFSLSVISGGVFFGAATPNQLVASKPCRKHDDLRRTIEKERIDSNGKGIDALLPEGRECCIDLGNGTRVEDYHLAPDIGGRGPNVVQLSIDMRHIRIDENADGRCIGSQLTQEPEPLRLQLGDKYADAGEIAAGPMQVGNQPAADRIRCDSKDHG